LVEYGPSICSFQGTDSSINGTLIAAGCYPETLIINVSRLD
jgi:hypothetical protein